MKTKLMLFVLFIFSMQLFAQPVRHFKIGETSSPKDAEISLTLVHRMQQYTSNTKDEHDIFDRHVNSPKSALILESKNKFYINSLEGYETVVYDLKTFELKKVIEHKFKEADAPLFQGEHTLFDYTYRTRSGNYNVFNGKPVEGCFSHNGKYLWVTYYRRSFDGNAIDPSAVAIIDTDTDSIVRVMPTAPLPKMIASSPDNKYVAVTHWGDNTVALIDISSKDPKDFKYTEHFVVERRLKLNYGNQKINRDSQCGYCLRGTVFTPDSKYLLIGRMGGGGIAVFDVAKREYLGTVFGMKNNLRHIVINNGYLYMSSNRNGYVEKCSVKDFISFATDSNRTSNTYDKFEGKYVGSGVRTIALSPSGKYIYAAVNNESKIAILQASTLEIVGTVGADSFPVGMDANDDYVIVTSQGKSKYGGGFSVMIYKIDAKQ